MHFLRGSGLAGLRGMQPASDHGFWTSEVELGAGTSNGMFWFVPSCPWLESTCWITASNRV